MSLPPVVRMKTECRGFLEGVKADALPRRAVVSKPARRRCGAIGVLAPGHGHGRPIGFALGGCFYHLAFLFAAHVRSPSVWDSDRAATNEPCRRENIKRSGAEFEWLKGDLATRHFWREKATKPVNFGPVRRVAVGHALAARRGLGPGSPQWPTNETDARLRASGAATWGTSRLAGGCRPSLAAVGARERALGTIERMAAEFAAAVSMLPQPLGRTDHDPAARRLVDRDDQRPPAIAAGPRRWRHLLDLDDFHRRDPAAHLRGVPAANLD